MFICLSTGLSGEHRCNDGAQKQRVTWSFGEGGIVQEGWLCQTDYRIKSCDVVFNFYSLMQCLNVVANVKHSEGRLKVQLSLACGYTTDMFCLFDRSKIERYAAILSASKLADRIAVQDCSPLEIYFLSLCFHFGVVL